MFIEAEIDYKAKYQAKRLHAKFTDPLGYTSKND